MPDLIPTEQVRADEIKEGDVIWSVELNDDGVPGAWRKVREVCPNTDGCEIWFADRCRKEPFVTGELVLRQAAPASPVGLREKLDEMRLHENTGDPGDEGYMKAIGELDDWLAFQENTGGESQ